MSAKILVIDDENIIRTSFSRVLSEDGYSVSTVDTGISALERIKNEIFDIFFVDLKIGDVNGIDVARSIREIQPNAKVIIVTGYGSEETKKQAYDIGITNFVSKPVSPIELTNLAECAIREQNKEKSLEIKKEEVQSYVKTFSTITSTVKEIEKVEITTEPSLVKITSSLVYGSILGLLFVVFLPITGLAMLMWIVMKKVMLTCIPKKEL